MPQTPLLGTSSSERSGSGARLRSPLYRELVPWPTPNARGVARGLNSRLRSGAASWLFVEVVRAKDDVDEQRLPFRARCSPDHCAMRRGFERRGIHAEPDLVKHRGLARFQ